MISKNQLVKFSYTSTLKDPSNLCCKPGSTKSETSIFITDIKGDIVKWKFGISYTPFDGDKNLKLYSTLTRLGGDYHIYERAVCFTVFLKNTKGKMQTHHSENISGYSENTNRYKLDINDYGFKDQDSSGSLQDWWVTCEIFFELPSVSYYCSRPNFCDLESKNLDTYEKFFESRPCLSDVKIVAGGKEFYAHKLMLSLRSEVFSAMFSGEEEKNFERTIEIENVNDDTVREMLRFIYTGKVQNLDKIAEDLLVMAVRYKMEDLKELCEETLIKSVNLKNYDTLFALALDNRAETLSKRMIEFMSEQVEECLEIKSNNLYD